MDINDKLRECIKDVLRLSIFKSFCECNQSKESKQKLRNIYKHSANPIETTRNLLMNELQEDVSKEDAEKIYPMIIAFLKKSDHRKIIPESIKKDLLKKQNNRCAICGKEIDIHAHADHTIPFKYVGDELKDNYQMLCTSCNLKKNANIDFQIRFLLKTL